MTTAAATFSERRAALPLTWAERVVMLAGGMATSLSLVTLTPVLPQIEAALATTADDRMLVKLLVTVVGGAMVVGAPLAGFLTDRIGVRRVLFVASLVFGLAGTAGLYLANLQLLMASRLLVGLASGAITAIAMTLINARLDDSGRARWMGYHVAVATLGSLVIHPMAGALGELGWRAPFILYALGFLFAGLALGSSDEPGAAGEGARDATPLLEWFPIRFIFLAICLGSITYMVPVYVPFVLRAAGVASPLLISLVGLGDAILTVSMALMFARARRRLSSQQAFAVSFAFAATGLTIVGFWPTVVGVIVGTAIFGLGIGWFVPNLMTAAAALVRSDQQGRTVGIVKAAHYLAAPLCVIAVEPLTRRYGPPSAFLGAATLSLILLVVFLARMGTSRRGAA